MGQGDLGVENGGGGEMCEGGKREMGKGCLVYS